MALVPWPTGEALAALINQAGTAGRTIYDEIRHGKIIIPAWMMGKKPKKGQPEPPSIEIPASLAMAGVALVGLYWYFHTEHNQNQSDPLEKASGLNAASWAALYAGGPVGLAVKLATEQLAAGLAPTTPPPPSPGVINADTPEPKLRAAAVAAQAWIAKINKALENAGLTDEQRQQLLNARDAYQAEFDSYIAEYMRRGLRY